MIFEAAFPDASQLLHLMDALSILDEANMFVTERGLELRAMDPSRVGMIDFSLPKSCFNSFELKDNEPIRLGIALDEIKGILRRYKQKEALLISLETPQHLEFECTGSYKKKALLSLLDLGESDYPAPNIAHNASITMLSSVFDEIIKDAEVVGDHIKIKANKKDRLISFRSASETKSFSAEISSDDDIVAKFEVKNDAAATYSLSYLKEFVRPKICDLVKISFAGSMPIEIEYPVLEKGKIRYFVAPRLEV